VLDSWDAADDSDAEREKAKKEVEAKAKAEAAAKAAHKSRKQRIEQKVEEKRRRRLEEDDEESTEDEDETARRIRLATEQKASDMRNAEDLFGELALGGAGGRAAEPRAATKAAKVQDATDAEGGVVDLAKLPIFSPNTKDQFTRLHETVAPLIAENASKAHYVLFMQEFVKTLCKDLPADQVKKIASNLTTLSNEKLKEEKAADKGGKKTKGKAKAVLNATRDVTRRADTNAYDDGLEEYVSALMETS
jgi:translation initiation factor 3 subunit J